MRSFLTLVAAVPLSLLLLAPASAFAASKAFAIVADTSTSANSNVLVDVLVHINVLGSDIGNLGGPNYGIYVIDLDPTAVPAVFSQAIAAAVQADMVNNRAIIFGMLDTVTVR
jgi:hypothetical protein